MVSKNTEDAIEAFREVLKARNRLNYANKELSSSVILVPESEMKYYHHETETLRKIWEGKDGT